ncbi:S9 family peptidase [Persicobacter psychrovividus]|uniref:Peptidase S9 n=1 Tax=Persicobacter psychrovividus TaxID=387638 RepID=A0ABN6LCU9_9BACT|nr:peptidase S9 [Persicobacter psychrovividus]
MKIFRRAIILLLFCTFFSEVNAQTTTPKLDIATLMQGDAFVGHLPDGAFWSIDGRAVYYHRKKDDNAYASLYRYDLETKNTMEVPESDYPYIPRNIVWNAERSQGAYLWQGNIYLVRQDSNKGQLAYQSTQRSGSLAWVDQGLTFTQNGNLYLLEQQPFALRQLTDFRSGTDPKTKKISAQKKWLKEDQLREFEILSAWDQRKKGKEAHLKATSVQALKPIYFGGASLYTVKASKDAKIIFYTTYTPAKATKTKMPKWVTASGYVEYGSYRSKVGDKQPTYRSYLYHVEEDTVVEINTATIEGIKDRPQYLKNYLQAGQEWQAEGEKEREVMIHEPVFSSDGKQAVVVIRSADNKDRWLMSLDLQNGTLSLLDRQHDDAWVGGPNISSWNGSRGALGWIDDEQVWFQSEKTGYSHLYTVNVTTKKIKALTKGDFEILEAELTQDKEAFFLLSNKKTPMEQHVYRMSVKGGKMEPLTQQSGGYSFTVSPDEKMLALRFSTANKPWELMLKPATAKSAMVAITHSTTPAFEAFEWRMPALKTFEARDGQQVYGRMFRPEEPNNKAVIFVHGAGYLQNVHSWWSAYFREYMFHNFLADQGYTVFHIDYRGSAGYGRDWRTGIYRHMGGKDLTDHEDAVKWLKQNYGIEKVGIYGGSYGGFMTLMAMFNAPALFDAGAAIRSVTDWAHYNHGYTSNILNTPAQDPKAYYDSSPIYFADGLQGPLLILHGMEDDNVQFQDVVRLNQKLIELGKENWQMALYPIEPHGFREANSWTDEYKRIFKLFEEHL